jgi:hypothetical protein
MSFRDRPNQVVPAGNATSSQQAATGEIVPAVIHDVFAHAGSYVVRTPGGRTQLAAQIADVGAVSTGARNIGHFNIQDQVICYFPPKSNFGYIIGAAPPRIFDSRFVLPDSLVMRSRAGFIEDQIHHMPFQREDNDLANFSCGRPADALPGDWGKINELGVAIWLGKFIAQLRASDAAKIEAFWGDDLLRIVGYNLQQFTAGSELSIVDDEGEFDEVAYYTPFMWEALGVYAAGTAVFDEHTGEDGALKQGSENSRFEPKELNQVMVPRSIDMRGYLGDLYHKRVVAPPVDATGTSKANDEKLYRGLAAVHIGLDGGVHIRSAKEVVIEKSLIMPVPRRLLDPDAPDGDNATNYKAAGYYGNGPNHEKKPYQWENTTSSAGRETSYWDYLAYLFGKFGLQTVDAHEKDWSTPEEADVDIASGVQNKIDAELFSNLGFDFTKPLPKFGSIVLDRRDGHSVRYYQARSGIFLSDDGSVIIEDGYGSQIIMSGGNIRVTCQGDVLTMPGRSAITWAPRDFIARSGWCAEMSAAKRDVRIKANNSLHMLSGDGSKGSVLIECRSKSPITKSEWQDKTGEDIEANGIIVLARDSNVGIWTKRLFGGVIDDDPGAIELNAGKGQVTLAGNGVGVEALAEYSIIIGEDRGATANPPQQIINTGGTLLRSKNVDVIGNLSTWPSRQGGSGSVSVGGSVKIKGNTEMEGSCTANRHFASKNGGVVTTNRQDFAFTPDPSGEGDKQETAADEVKERMFEQTFDEKVFEDTETGLAKESVIKPVGFSFRKSTEHYMAGTFIIYESRWQQLYRVNGANLTWDEPVVMAPSGQSTMPHPGHDAWQTAQQYKYIPAESAKNVNHSTGVSKERSEQSEAGAVSTEGTFASEYVINVQQD